MLHPCGILTGGQPIIVGDCEKDDILRLNSDGMLNGTAAGCDGKTLVYYTENALKPGDRLTFRLEKQ